METQPLREPPLEPRSAGWTFDHPSHGTCVPDCPSYGTCHCGCGATPKRSAVTSVPWNRHAGHPFTFVPGHQLRVVHPRAGMWSKQGVPVERVRPLIRWLRMQHGSVRAVAELLQMPESTLRGYLYNAKRKRVPPEAVVEGIKGAAIFDDLIQRDLEFIVQIGPDGNHRPVAEVGEMLEIVRRRRDVDAVVEALVEEVKGIAPME